MTEAEINSFKVRLASLQRENIELKAEMNSVKARLASSQRENIELKSKLVFHEKAIILLHFGIIGAISFPISAGVPIAAPQLLDLILKITKQVIDHETKEHYRKVINWVLYGLIVMVFLPIIGCIIHNGVLNCGNLHHEINYDQCDKSDNPNIVKCWWRNFTSPQNFKKNLAYYGAIFLVAACFSALQIFIVQPGVDSLLKDVVNYGTEIRLFAKIIFAVAFAVVGCIFSFATRNLLWSEPVPSELDEVKIACAGINPGTSIYRE